MSAWVVGLALSAGYLINKNLHFKSKIDKLEEATTKYNNAVEPASPGPTTKAIRKTQSDPTRTVGKSGGRYDDFNQENGTSRAEMNQVLAVQDSLAQEVQNYELPPRFPEIEGVMLLRDNFGI